MIYTESDLVIPTLIYLSSIERSASTSELIEHLQDILKPEGKTSMHNISSIRNLISEVFMAPFEAEAKVFIIEEFNLLSLSCIP